MQRRRWLSIVFSVAVFGAGTALATPAHAAPASGPETDQVGAGAPWWGPGEGIDDAPEPAPPAVFRSAHRRYIFPF